MRPLAIVLLICVLALGHGVAVALAQASAGIDQYTEHIPSSGGETPTKTLPSGSSDRHGFSLLSPRQVRLLEARGEDGEAVVRLAEATGPARSGRAKTKSGASGAELSSSVRGDGKSWLSGVVSSLTGGDGSGMGPMLPVLLIATALGAAAYAVVRRARSRSGA